MSWLVFYLFALLLGVIGGSVFFKIKDLREINERGSNLHRDNVLDNEELEPLILAERLRGLSLSLLQIRRKADVSEELVKIRRKNLLLQMNPHFIFNVLTGIHMLLIKGNTQKTLGALGKFKRLLIRGWGSATDNPNSLRERLKLISEIAEFRLENRKDKQGCVASIVLPYNDSLRA